MSSIIALIYAVSSLLLALAAVITAIAKFKTAATKRATEAQSMIAGSKIGVTRWDLFFVVMGISSMAVGIGWLAWMLSQPDGPATKHSVADVGLGLVDFISGNLMLTTTTIRRLVA